MIAFDLWIRADDLHFAWGASSEAQGHCHCVRDGNYFLCKEKTPHWLSKMKKWSILYKPIHPATTIGEKFYFLNAAPQGISSATCYCRDEAGWAGTQHMVGMDWETGTAASQATARSSHHPVSVVLLWRSHLEENFPTGLAAVLGPVSHYKTPTVLSGRRKQPESEEQREPQTTYHGITNACMIQGDTRCWDPTQALISVRKFSDL